MFVLECKSAAWYILKAYDTIEIYNLQSCLIHKVFLKLDSTCVKNPCHISFFSEFSNAYRML